MFLAADTKYLTLPLATKIVDPECFLVLFLFKPTINLKEDVYTTIISSLLS